MRKACRKVYINYTLILTLKTGDGFVSGINVPDWDAKLSLPPKIINTLCIYNLCYYWLSQWFCIKIGSGEKAILKVSLIVGGKVTKIKTVSTNHCDNVTLEDKGQPKVNRTDVLLFTRQTRRLTGDKPVHSQVSLTERTTKRVSLIFTASSDTRTASRCLWGIKSRGLLPLLSVVVSYDWLIKPSYYPTDSIGRHG